MACCSPWDRKESDTTQQLNNSNTLFQLVIVLISLLLNYFVSLERYRIQSELFEDLWLITNELIVRLQEYFEKQGIKDFTCSFSGPVPLQEYFELIDHHFEVCMIITYILCNFSVYAKEGDPVEVRILVYMPLGSTLSCYSYVGGGVVNLFLPSCQFVINCRLLQSGCLELSMWSDLRTELV